MSGSGRKKGKRAPLTPGERRRLRQLVVCLVLYAGMKGVSFFAGANGLAWHIPTGTPGDILSGGLILPLNICVGVITAGCVITAYVLFTRAE